MVVLVPATDTAPRLCFHDFHCKNRTASPSLVPNVKACSDSLPHGLLVIQVCLVHMISKVMHTRNSQQMLRRRLLLVLGSANIRIQVQQRAMLLLGMHMQDSLQLMMAWAVNRMAPSILLVFNRPHLLLKCPLLRPFNVLYYCLSQISCRHCACA